MINRTDPNDRLFSGCQAARKIPATRPDNSVQRAIEASVSCRPWLGVASTATAVILIVALRRYVPDALLALLTQAVCNSCWRNGQLRRNHRKTVVRLKWLATVDHLTGLSNRRTTEERLHDLYARNLRMGRSLAVLLIDVDHFRDFNTLHGHARGDAVLRDVAEAIRRNCRTAADIAGRLGGEEFILVIDGAGEAEAAELAERMRAEIEEMTEATVSVGTALADEAGTPEGVVAIADRRMYQAKDAGRNRVVSR